MSLAIKIRCSKGGETKPMKKTHIKRITVIITITCLIVTMVPNVWAAQSFPASGKMGDDVTWTKNSANATDPLIISGSGATWDLNAPGENREWTVFMDQDGKEQRPDTIQITDGVTAIGRYAFANMGRVGQVMISESVTHIGANAFSGIEEIFGVYYTGSKEQWEKIRIENGNDALIDAKSIRYWYQSKDMPRKTEIPDDTSTPTSTVGSTLQLRGVSYTYTSDTVGLRGSNPDAVGMMQFSMTVEGPQKVETVLIAGFFEKLFTDKEVSNLLAQHSALLKKENTPLLLKSVPFDGGSIAPVMREQLGKTLYYVFVGYDKNTNPIAYAIIPVIEGSSGQTAPIAPAKQTDETQTNSKSAEIIESGPLGEHVSWTLNTEGLLFISGSGAMWDYDHYANDHVWWTGWGLDGRQVSVKKIRISNGITTIGDLVFAAWDRNISIEMPDSITKLGWGAFWSCGGLTEINLSKNLTSIGHEAFVWCNNLTTVYIPSSVETIENGAFSACNSLSDIYYAGSKWQWDKIKIGDYNEPLHNATIHYGVTNQEDNTTSTIGVAVNGDPVHWTDAVPFINANNRTMVPLRAVGDALGLTVNWDGAKREAVFSNGDKTICFPIDSSIARTNNGRQIVMDTAAIVIDGRTYAPIRYLAEFFGYSVDWDGTSRTVIIK